MRKYLAFDIEIRKVLPAGLDDWKSHRPLGITCAATYQGEGKPQVWFGRTSVGEIANQMSVSELMALVEYLERAVREGYTLLTWNGLAFDFDILGEESGLDARCAQLAWEHVDMMFHIFCIQGHMLGLDIAAKGMGLPGKPAGMSGELAPRYWAEGKKAIVLDYVAQDVRTTLDLAYTVERQGELRWISKRGVRQSLSLPSGWLSVHQALGLPEPDTSWMQRPLKRKRFTQWLARGGITGY